MLGLRRRLDRRGSRLAVAIAGLMVIVLGVGCQAERREFPRVLMIGIDGLDPGIVSRLMDAGRLPTFSQLRDEGAFGRLRSSEPLLSPLIWTTIATGHKPQDHGILDFVEGTADGDVVPITSRRRRVPALWDLATESGLSTGFVGWYATYPAEPVNGFQVSDRIGYHQVKSATSDRAVTHPESLAAWLREEVGEAEVDLERTRSRFANPGQIVHTEDGEERLAKLAEIHATAELYRESSRVLAERFRPDLMAVYFELIDACGHLFMEDATPRRPQSSDENFAAFSGTVDRCYAYQDTVLGDLLQLAGPETTVLVVSDHGFKSGDQRPDTSGRADTGVAGLWHRLHGAMFLRGPGVRPGSSISQASVFDITPTVLALLDLPVSDELSGTVLSQVFEPGKAPRVRSGGPSSWVPQVSVADDSESSQATEGSSNQLAKLQALGYIGSPNAAPPVDDNGRTAASYVNEGTSLVVDGEIDAALRAYSRALTLDPHNAQAIALSSRLLIGRGDLEPATRLLSAAVVDHPQSVFIRLERAHLALRRGAWAEAQQELAAAEALDSNLVHLAMYKAQWANATGAPEQALDELKRAESLTEPGPMLLEILLFRARIAAEQGRLDIAERSLQQARPLAAADHRLAAAQADLALAKARHSEAAELFRVAIEHNALDPVLERKLGQALAGREDAAAAEQAFLRALEKSTSPVDRAGAYGDLALLLQQQRRDAEVVELLHRATREVPRAANLWALLGAAHGRLESFEDSLAAYQRSIDLEEHPLALKTAAALLLHLRGDQTQAADFLRRSLVLLPGQRDVEAMLREVASDAKPTAGP